jgi:two-component system, LytTR family, response regulator
MVSVLNHSEHALNSITDKLIVHCGRKIHFIEIGSIGYIKACNYYALIFTKDKTYVARQTLDEFEKKLDAHSFLRIHRSIILNLNIFQCVERENKKLVVRTTIGKTFKISRYRQKAVKSRILS